MKTNIVGGDVVRTWQFGIANARFFSREAKINPDKLPTGTPVAQKRPGEYVEWRPGLQCGGMVLASRNGYASILTGRATVDSAKISVELSKEALAALRALGIEISEEFARRAQG